MLTCITVKVQTRVRMWSKNGPLFFLGWTPLHEAAVHYGAQIQDILELLVSKGADINARANNGSTPLHDAIMFLPEVTKI